MVDQRLEVEKQHSEEMGLQGSKLDLGEMVRNYFPLVDCYSVVIDKDNDKNLLFPTQDSC